MTDLLFLLISLVELFAVGFYQGYQFRKFVEVEDEMTIDNAILQLEECKAYRQCDTEKDINAFDVAIDTMRKYQKLKQTLDIIFALDYENNGRTVKICELREALEGGNDD